MADSAAGTSGTSTSARNPSLPRLTPSTGARCPSASRMARSMVPSPPRLTSRSERVASSAGGTATAEQLSRLISCSMPRTSTPLRCAQFRIAVTASAESRSGCRTMPTTCKSAHTHHRSAAGGACPFASGGTLWYRLRPNPPPRWPRIRCDEALRWRVGDHTVQKASVVDAESAGWLRALAEAGPRREAALARLHEMLVRIARSEAARRGPRLRITGPELDDLAYQAAADALLAITGKLGQFRGESRFTTWAYKFVIFEVSAKIGRHFWRHPAVALEAEWGDLFAALRRAVDTELTPRQREIFVAIVLNEVPLDTLVIHLGSSRNAIYQVLFEARRKLRAALVAGGYLGENTAG